jgi:UDP:flavonoid glycosyltransferase YjiC (YdhE family)
VGLTQASPRRITIGKVAAISWEAQLRALFTTVPAFGHFHPLVPLALAAVEHGDEVLVATGSRLSNWVEACGLPHAEVEHYGVPAPAVAEQMRRSWGDLSPFHVFTTVLAPPMIRGLIDLCDRWQPDVIIHEETEYAAPLVGELLDLPCITHSYCAPARPEQERAIMLNLLAPIWHQHTTAAPSLSGFVYLDACPPPFQTDSIRSIPDVRPVRPVSFDGPPADAPPWVEAIGRPAVYVTFGTAPPFAQVKVIQDAMDAVAKCVTSVVVTTGPNPTTDFRVPKNALIETYVRQSAILGSVDVVVSHGGAGTTLGAIEFGLPHIVIPQQTMSQLRNAEQVEALGIGVHVDAGSGPDGIRNALQQTLDHPGYAQKAAELRESLHSLPGPERVLDDLHRQLA